MPRMVICMSYLGIPGGAAGVDRVERRATQQGHALRPGGGGHKGGEVVIPAGLQTNMRGGRFILSLFPVDDPVYTTRPTLAQPSRHPCTPGVTVEYWRKDLELVGHCGCLLLLPSDDDDVRHLMSRELDGLPNPTPIQKTQSLAQCPVGATIGLDITQVSHSTGADVTTAVEGECWHAQGRTSTWLTAGM